MRLQCLFFDGQLYHARVRKSQTYIMNVIYLGVRQVSVMNIDANSFIVSQVQAQVSVNMNV